MPKFSPFLRSVGRAILRHGPRALAGLMPMGASLYDAAHDILLEYRGKGKENALLIEVAALAQTGPTETKKAVEAVVSEVAADQPATVQRALTAYLTQVPSALRQSLRRPDDPTGKTVPAGMALRRPEDLLPLLPQGLPRFKPGDRPLPGVDRELVELLGSGGFGEVWTARNPFQKSAPVVALKFCLDEQAAKALRNEAALLDRVAHHGRHPGLVALHQTYLSATPPCLEYEYVNGGDLTEMMRERRVKGGIRPEEAARLMLQIAKAVAFAHQRGIVHRDLKPANILVERMADGTTRLKVADFGIGGLASDWGLAKLGGRTQTRQQDMTLALRGAYSPLYASPQQVRGGSEYRPDPRDDVYALGVIWYQLLNGDLTSGAPSGVTWAKELAKAGVPKEQLTLMMSCFEANPAGRPTDAAHLARQLSDQLVPMVLPAERPAERPATRPAAPPVKKERRYRQPRRAAQPQGQSAAGACGTVLAVLLLFVAIGVTAFLLTNRLSSDDDPPASTRPAGSDRKIDKIDPPKGKIDDKGPDKPKEGGKPIDKEPEKKEEKKPVKFKDEVRPEEKPYEGTK